MNEVEKDKLNQVLLRARIERPYYAVALSALRPVLHDNPEPRAAVDTSWRLYLSRAWLMSEPTEAVAKVIACHEVEHLLRDHAGRKGPRDHKAWNACGDAEINDDYPWLITYGGGVSPADLKQPEGLLAEQYYESLEESAKECRCGSGAGGARESVEQDPDGMTHAEAEQIREHVASEVRALPPGTVPRGVEVWANERAKAHVVPWPRQLASAVRQGLRAVPGRTDYDRKRPSRRVRPVVHPRSTAYAPDIGLVIDTSGSVDGADALGVVEATLRKFGRPVVTVDCDTEAHVGNARGPRKGGGGTDMRVGIKKAQDKGAKTIVIVTDGHTPWPEEPFAGLVVVLIGDGATPEWAATVRVC